MTRAEIWLAQVGRKSRPVLILTRPEVIDVRELVTVAEITTHMRGLAVEVELDHRRVGLSRPSAINIRCGYSGRLKMRVCVQASTSGWVMRT